MKNTGKLMMVLMLFIALTSCEKNIFGPNEGSLSGTITDNNGELIQGAKITATYTDGDETGSVSTSSDEFGFYTLVKIRLSENIVSVEATGFENDERVVFLDQDSDDQNLSFTLDGAPFLESYVLSSNVLDTTSGSSDSSATLTVNIKDNYNTSSLTSYTVNAVFEHTADNTIEKIVSLDALGNTTTLFVLETTFLASDIAVGNYNISLEIEDPDGNSYTIANIENIDVI